MSDELVWQVLNQQFCSFKITYALAIWTRWHI